MALSTPTTLTSGGGSAAASFTTASVTSATDDLLLLTVHCYVSSGSTQPTVPTVAGLGRTWTQVGSSMIVDNSGTDRATMFLFRAMGAGATGTLTITPNSSQKVSWILQKVTGADTSGTEGSGAIVASSFVKTESASVATISTTSPTMASSNNMLYGGVGSQSTTAKTWNNSWTKSVEVTTNSVTYVGVGYFQGTGQLTQNVTWTTSGRSAAYGVEIAAAVPPAGPVGPSNITLPALTGAGTGTVETPPGTALTVFGQPTAPETIAFDTADYTLGMQFSVSEDAALSGIWFHSPEGAGQLPTQVGIYRVSNQTLVASHTDIQPDLPALPGTIGGVEPETHAHNPTHMVNGVLYRVMESDLASGNHPAMMKSTDGGATWTEMNSAARPSAQDLEGVWTVLTGTTILVYVNRDDTCWRVPFDTTTDLWGTQETVKTGMSSSGVEQYVSAVVLSNGDEWIAYSNTLAGANNQAAVRKRTGANTYGTEIDLGGNTAISWTGPVLVKGASDVTHVFYKDDTNNRLYWRTLSSTGTLSAATRIDSAGTATDNIVHTNAVYFDNGGTETVAIAYADGSDLLHYVRIVGGSVQSPEQISDAAILMDPGAATNGGTVAHLANDGTTVHAVWARASDGSVYRDSRTVSGAWGTDVLVVPFTAGATDYAEYVYAAVHQYPAGVRGGAKVLAVVYDIGEHANDVSNMRYTEVTLVAGTTSDGSWSGAAGSGWVKSAFDESVTLLAGVNYKVAVAAPSGSNWFSATDNYWGSGPGAAGVSNGILSAPNDSITGGQDSYHTPSSGVLAYPDTQTATGTNYWLDVEVVTLDESGPVSGSSSATLPHLTGAATGVTTLTGAAAATLPVLAAAATAAVLLTGAAAATLPSLSSTGTGQVSAAGASATSLPPLTSTGTGAVSTTGASSATLPPLTGTTAAAVSTTGASATSLPSLTSAGTATLTVTGTSTGTFTVVTHTATGEVRLDGASTITLPALTGSATADADPPINGAGDGVLPALTGSATGTLTADGASAAALPALQAASTADVRVDAASATTLPAFTSTGTGVAVVDAASSASLPSLTGTGTGTLSLAGASAGTFPGPTGAGTADLGLTGASAATLPALTGAGTADVALTGAGSGTLPPIGGVGTADVRTDGTSGAVLPSLTGTGTGTTALTGSSAAILPSLLSSGTSETFDVITGTSDGQIVGPIGAGTGTVSLTGAGTAPLPSLTGAATGTARTAGASTATLPPLTGAGTGTLRLTGSSAATLPALLCTVTTGEATPAVGDGAHTLPAITSTGTAAVTTAGASTTTLPSVSSTATGALRAPGTSAATLPAVTSTGTGELTTTGTATRALPSLTSTAAGDLTITGESTVTLPSIEGSANDRPQRDLDVTGILVGDRYAATLDTSDRYSATVVEDRYRMELTE